MLNWTTEKRKVKDLVEMPENPRQLTKQQASNLKKSFEKFNLVEIPVIDTDNTLIAGHQRMKMMSLLGRGDEEIDVRVPSRKLSDSERKEYNLRSNKNTGEWDNDKLAQYFDEEMLKEVGFDEDEIAKALSKVIDGEEDDFDTTPPEEPKTKLGDVFILGDHVLMCGDSTKKEDVEKLMGGEKADMVFTDPPYGLGGYGGRNNMDLKGDDGTEYQIKSFYDAVPLDIPEVYIWGNWKNLMKHLSAEPRDVIIWKKNNFGLGVGYRGQYEMCFYYGSFKGSDSDVWEIARDSNYVHPTQKPIELVVRALQNSSKTKDVILDIFGGSGSTLIACEQTGRKCRMMELDPKYCDVIIARWEKLTGKQAKKII